MADGGFGFDTDLAHGGMRHGRPVRLGPMAEHLWLLKRMGLAVQADFDRAMRDGQISQHDWAAMVNRCRGCARPGACARWLDLVRDVEAPPRGCENRAVLKRLADGRTAETV